MEQVIVGNFLGECSALNRTPLKRSTKKRKYVSSVDRDDQVEIDRIAATSVPGGEKPEVCAGTRNFHW